MSQRRLASEVLALTITLAPAGAFAQTATYHLHKEASTTSGVFQLKSSGPDAVKTSMQSIDLKNRAAGEYVIKQFDTPAGVPNAGGAIPAGSTVSFTLWMKQTSNFGTMQPRARVRVNNAAGAELCQANGTSNLTTSLTAYTLSCVTSSSVALSTTDRYYLWVGVNLTSPPGNHAAGGELDVEGALNGTYDSRLTIPLPLAPSISTVTPSSGAPTTSVTISGANFGSSQGGSTAQFNGVQSAPTSWGPTAITTTVPVAATTGPVVVTVGGAASNGIIFTVIPPSLTAVTPASAHVGDAVTITGANFLATQGSSTVRFNGAPGVPTSWSDTTIVVPVPSGAATGQIVVTVGSQSSNGLPFTVIVPGSIRGVITRASNGAAIAGAAVQALRAGAVVASATTAADGTYAINGLDPGMFDLRVTAGGFADEIRRAIAVQSGTVTVANVAMAAAGALAGIVTRADGTTPIAGASLTVYANGFSYGTSNTNAVGAYGIGSLPAGSYTVQAAAVGYQTASLAVDILESATTTADFSLNAAPAGSVSYAYDAIGRLIQVTDPAGASAIYRYDAVGNVVAIERPGIAGGGSVAISGMSPTHGPAGTAVTIAGTGFSATATSNIVTFNGVVAPVQSALPTVLVAVVPGGAATGPVGVTTPTGSAVSVAPFVVSADSPTIASFTPTIGTAGTPLTISGTNFDPALANNRVTVNTTWQPSLTGGNSTSLALAVPGASTSGRISVTTPIGTAISNGDFFVPPAPYVASDVAVADRMAIGSSRSVTIDTAGKIALLLFDGIAGRQISLRATNVVYTGDCIIGSYTVSILQPNGSTLTSVGRGCSPGVFIDQRTLPTSGVYTVLLDPILSNTGTLTLTLYDVTDVIGPIATGGTSVPVTISTPGQNARLTFNGTAGQVVSATSTSGTWTSCQFGGQYNFGIVKPDGSNLVIVPNACGPTTFIDHLMLPVTGTYTLWLDPYGANTGSASLAVHTIVDVTGPIAADGTSLPVTITSPGQNARLTFPGAAGQIVSAWATATFWACTATTFYVSIVKPDGSVLKSVYNGCSTAFTDQVTLPVDGPYTLVFDPSGTNTGNATLRLFTVVDTIGPITINGPSVPVSVTTPSQNARLTFDGTAGQVVTASAMSSTWTACVTLQFDLYLVKPDGSTLASTFGCWGSAVLSQKTLPVSGTYTIRVDPRELNTGTATVSLTSP